MQAEPVGVPARVDRLRASIRRLAPHVGDCPLVVNTGAADHGDVGGMVETSTYELRGLADAAVECGVRLALEPLSPTAMNTETAIWTVAQALDILDVVDRHNVGLCLNLWNVWQEPGLENAIRRAAERIFVLQVSDWRIPRSATDRLVPGDGAIPIGCLLRSVLQAGYRGACTVEILSHNVKDSLYAGDPGAVVERSRDGLARAWATSSSPRAATV